MTTRIQASFYDPRYGKLCQPDLSPLGAKQLLEDLLSDNFTGTVEIEVTND